MTSDTENKTDFDVVQAYFKCASRCNSIGLRFVAAYSFNCFHVIRFSQGGGTMDDEVLFGSSSIWAVKEWLDRNENSAAFRYVKD